MDAKDVLEKITALPIYDWNYTGYPQRHIGPMAQDFHAAFPLNPNDKAIDSGDLQGVALAAIQGLSRQNLDLIKENTEMKQRLAVLEQTVRKLVDTPLMNEKRDLK